MRLVLLGAPGSGKGTQGQRLAAFYGVPHIATGDLIRDHIARRTDFGRKVEAAIAAGNFAPDEDILYWVGRRLAEPDARRGCILDGFPRDLAQARSWDGRTRGTDTALDAVVELRMSEEALVERLVGRWVCPADGESYHVVHHPPQVPGHCDRDGVALVRRPDDAPGAVRRRLSVYNERTLPLRDYYRAQGLLHTVDAADDADAVAERIIFALQGLKNAAVEV